MSGLLVGLVGRAGAGKDTIASGWEEVAGLSATRLAMADPLRELVSAFTRIPVAAMLDRDQKEAPLPEPIELDEHVYLMREMTGLPIVPHGLRAPTIRAALQLVGTEYVRAARSTYWLEVFRARAEWLLAGNDLVAVTDVRFLNEAAEIERFGGYLVRVFRPGYSDRPAAHASETEQDRIFAHARIDNASDLRSFQRDAYELLCSIRARKRLGIGPGPIPGWPSGTCEVETTSHGTPDQAAAAPSGK